jgi:predicted kinase
MKRLLILRSAPGGGKSTYANRVKAKMRGLFGASVCIASADSYFIKNGTYRYDRAKIGKAHEECRKQAHQAFLRDIPYILVDNTNVQRSDFKDYVRMAQEFGYEIVEKVFGLDLDVTQLHARNQHGVPLDKVKLMDYKLRDSIRNVEGQTVKKVNGILTVRIKR